MKRNNRPKGRSLKIETLESRQMFAGDTVGFYEPGASMYHLKETFSPGNSDIYFNYGPSGTNNWAPLTGDWNGDGKGTVGFYDPTQSLFHLKDQFQPGSSDHYFQFGPSGNRGWIPLVGDWNGDGFDTVGFYQPDLSLFHLKNSFAPGASDIYFQFGPSGGAGWKPLVGDWDGDGVDTIGLYDSNSAFFHLKNSFTPGNADQYSQFGPSGNLGWTAIVGDWNGNGFDSIGLYQPDNSLFHLKNSVTPGPSDAYFQFGPTGYANWTPVVGDWNGRADPFELSANLSTVAVQANTQVVFSINIPASTEVGRVFLYKADAAGNPTNELLVELYDSGQFVNRDTAANDSIYSNSIAINLPSAGPYGFAAVATIDGQSRSFSTAITAIQSSSSELVAARDQRLIQTQTSLDEQIELGVPVRQALENVKQAVAVDPDVRQDSIVVSANGVYWQTEDGTGMGVLSSVESVTVRSGAGSSPTEAVDNTTCSSDELISGEGSDDSCGKAIVLGAFYSSFSVGGGDESKDLAGKLRNNGYDVVEQYDAQVTVSDFANLGQYDVVVVTSHGDSWVVPNGTGGLSTETVILTRERVIPGQEPYYNAIAAGLIKKISGYYAITPRFFETFTGQMDNSVVYFGACRTARGSDMANAFTGLGASVYMSYTDYVKSSFAYNRGIAAFDYLLGGGAVGAIPGLFGDDGPEDDSKDSIPDPAQFRTFYSDGTKKLEPKCDLLKDYDLVLTYTWPESQKDLDTGTKFLSKTVGYRGSGSPYMSFSGDDTSYGGVETIVVDLYKAFRDGGWNDQTIVDAVAGWYVPAQGSGPALLTVGMKRKSDGQVKNSSQKTINPGSQSGLATTLVGQAKITEFGAASAERIRFTLE
jgi:hypothetical protein